MYRFILINDPLFHWAISSPCYLSAFSGAIFLGLISSIRFLTARYWPFLLVGQIQLVVTVGPFGAVNPFGRFHSVIKYGPLTAARYNRPMNGRYQL